MTSPHLRDHTRPRVVITGMGVITTVGDNLVDYFDGLIAGRSGIGHWKHMDNRIYSKIGGDLSDFELNAYLSRSGKGLPSQLAEKTRKLLRVSPLSGRLTAIAALQAYVNAGLVDCHVAVERVGHVLGGHNLTQNYFFSNIPEYQSEPDFIDPLLGVVILDTDILSTVNELIDARGPSLTVGNACASGNVGVLNGLDLIRAGRADYVLVTGAALDIDPVVLQGWALIESISIKSFNHSPGQASRPFDARREGFVPSHGAGALMLERLDVAERRGACIHAEVLGAASCSDASRQPKPCLDGQVRAMEAALADARISSDQVDYVNAHATSTVVGDAMEVMALKKLFGSHASKIPINSTKSIIGHCLTASGVVEIIATVLQMEHRIIHPTINQEEKDPELDLDFVPNKAREHKIRVALSNAFGFGGLNSCVVIAQAP